ncbi:ribonuclease H-like domain-containing protein [Tanacetum coccineum]
MISMAPVSAIRPINTAAPKPFMNVTRTRPNAFHKSHLTSRTPFNQQTSIKNRNLNDRVNTAKVNSINTAKINSINTGKGIKVTSAVGKQGINIVKSSACWIWRQKRNVIDHISKDSGSYMPKRFDYVDPQGRLKHMTGNKFYLSDYQDIDGGFVAFGGSSKRGKITGKGKIRIGKLDFEDVYFVKELKFNLFSVSQMCDKKNSVLFTETEYLVLSPDFKLLDESQLLHMDLFGPIFVRSINRKSYYLVVTDDFSRFSWVFFLAIKDETPEILKNFITGIENQSDHKGIKREFSIARTPQQNGVAERKNKTLIDAARTMLADSKLPTTFWAEAVNTACYVQNRVLVIKPYNKTPYGFFLGTKENIDAGQAEINTVLGPQYVLLPFLTSVSQSLKNSEDEVADDAGKKNGVQDPAKEDDINGLGEATTTNITNILNTVSSPVNVDANSTYRMLTPVSAAESSYENLGGSTPVNAANPSNANYPTDPLMSNLEDTVDLQDTGIFGNAFDDADVGAEADLNNLETTMNVSPIPITRIHKDHPKE